MKIMKKFFDKIQDILIPLWGMLWITAITATSLTLAILAIKWMLVVVGVM